MIDFRFNALALVEHNMKRIAYVKFFVLKSLTTIC